jgi:hypothetical protein
LAALCNIGIYKSGTLATTSGTTSIEDYGNGWYRIITNGTESTGKASIGIYFAQAQLTSSLLILVLVTDSFYAWGVQIEAGAYATSYIPTLGAAVTRGADACIKTGISSLIGQTEGTMFVEVKD